MDSVRIDFDALNELKDMLEDEFLELIETYKADMLQKSESLIGEINQGNDEAVRKLAHSMKGASLNIGVVHFSSLCHQLEEDAKAEDKTKYKLHYDQISQELESVISELDAFVA